MNDLRIIQKARSADHRSIFLGTTFIVTLEGQYYTKPYLVFHVHCLSFLTLAVCQREFMIIRTNTTNA